jgi:hypothetical protein
MLIIVAAQEAKIQRVTVSGQLRKKVLKTASQPINSRHGGAHQLSQLNGES